MESKMSNTTNLDFSNTEIAFGHKSDQELKDTYRIFKMMNSPNLVKLGSAMTLLMSKLKLPLLDPIIKATVFKQFCGGTNLLDCQSTIDKLYKNKTMSILDFGVEAKDTEKDFDYTLAEILKAIQFGAANASVPVISLKISSIARNGLLEKWQGHKPLEPFEEDELAKVKKRLHRIMHMASDMGIGVFVDAEETWVQEAMDALAEELMETYNKKKVVAYNTFQMYRKDRLDYLKYSFERSQNKNYYLGAKIVRGAYMVKERQRAEDQGIASPIQDNKEATDLAFDQAIGFCVKHYNRISSCNASHNAASCLLQARLISELSIPRNHSHLNFCQLMGMSDNITFNLAQQGYNVAKYVVYGSIAEVIPFLIRRAHENTSITGDVGRELGLITEEMARRRLIK
ncbi:MAG: proline dehydrogenase family protein [Saprospiraceae bacterium]|jgi:proline dehydrogenase|nr:proline dehydrogenase family protein [Saprospiraceae bacterium]MBK7371033.1 proline dehydrogenase family protein [Saprospiraceae bacterium]MBK7436466.1 proline dehydrogenase family protein [Saprospiraceae bacterium]MBK7609380.1 proline dehydrogenase family protein [Saprospiraceae bacterium]MBK9928996.1 proline dehydrogenase family protein [Saprospiraceae bacterium]